MDLRIIAWCPGMGARNAEVSVANKPKTTTLNHLLAMVEHATLQSS